MVGQQLVAVVVEVADQRHVDAHRGEPLADVRHGGGGLVAVDGDAHELGAGARQRRDLATVASTSAVSVLVIDCTTIGAPPPTITPPILTGTERRRAELSMAQGYIRFLAAAPGQASAAS